MSLHGHFPQNTNALFLQALGRHLCAWHAESVELGGVIIRGSGERQPWRGDGAQAELITAASTRTNLAAMSAGRTMTISVRHLLRSGQSERGARRLVVGQSGPCGCTGTTSAIRQILAAGAFA